MDVVLHPPHDHVSLFSTFIFSFFPPSCLLEEFFFSCRHQLVIMEVWTTTPCRSPPFDISTTGRLRRRHLSFPLSPHPSVFVRAISSLSSTQPFLCPHAPSTIRYVGPRCVARSAPSESPALSAQARLRLDDEPCPTPERRFFFFGRFARDKFVSSPVSLPPFSEHQPTHGGFSKVFTYRKTPLFLPRLMRNFAFNAISSPPPHRAPPRLFSASSRQLESFAFFFTASSSGLSAFRPHLKTCALPTLTFYFF